MEIVFWTIGLISGFCIAKAISGKYEGDKLERSLRFYVGSYVVHIHHWLYLSVVGAILWFTNIHYPFLFGFLAGAIIQGLLYRHRFVFVYKKDRFK